jgi:RNA 2',3'-cyclic 3'-phosphodiesterase
LHVTLLFLGEASPEVWSVAASAVSGMRTPRFAVKGVVGVPRRRPRLFALDLEDAGRRGAAIQTAVAEALGIELERPFWPHVTLVRVRKGRRPEAPRPPADIAPFAPTALTLYRSHPGPRGSRYEALERLGLASS